MFIEHIGSLCYPVGPVLGIAKLGYARQSGAVTRKTKAVEDFFPDIYTFSGFAGRRTACRGRSPDRFLDRLFPAFYGNLSRTPKTREKIIKITTITVSRPMMVI
jgi:hypothetical protein